MKAINHRFGWHSGVVNAKDVVVNEAQGLPVQIFTATAVPAGGVQTACGFIGLKHDTVAILLTIPAPKYVGQQLIIRDNSASGTAAHVCTAKAGTTFDGTNNTATFNAPGEQLILQAISLTQWIILLNSGSVGLSSV